MRAAVTIIIAGVLLCQAWGYDVTAKMPRSLLRRMRVKRGGGGTDVRASTSRTWAIAAVPGSGSGLNVSPADFGGDPTGQKDSTTAVLQALDTCLNASSFNPGRTFPYQGSDLAGCRVVLNGEYLISKPLVIPFNVSNMAISDGSLVASPSFPPNTFMITVGAGYCHTPQGSCIEDIGLGPSLFIDGSRVASGAIQVNAVMGTTIGPQAYILNYTTNGIQVNGGHEVMIHQTWLGEVNFDHKFAGGADVPTSTAIDINSNDHYIEDSIVFASKTGLYMRGAANIVSGLHVWFPWNEAKQFDSHAFYITGSQNRFDGCYVDDAVMVLTDSASLFVWTNGFMLASTLALVGNDFQKISFTQNEFQGGPAHGISVVNNTKPPTFTDVAIHNNIFNNGGGSSTRRTQTMSVGTSSTSFDVDFCDGSLIGGAIASLTFSASAPGLSSSFRGCKATFTHPTGFVGDVSVSVDASKYSATCLYC